jgi:integral membrane protein (TIGR00529 family)
MENFLPLVFVLAIFGIVLVISRKTELGYALFAGSVLLGVSFRMPPLEFLQSILHAASDPKTISLLASIFLILMLNETLKVSGQMEKLVQASINLLHDVRLTTFFLPALIGMLPLPGGAYFSAPMVESTLGKRNINPEKKLFANYWFRHTGEYINPVYPGIVATATLTGLNFRMIMKANIWLSLAAIIAGALIVFGGKNQDFKNEEREYRGNLKEARIFLGGAYPILLILSLVIFFGLNIVCSLASGVLVLLIHSRPGKKEMKQILKKAASVQMLCMILGIVFFQNVLADSGAVEKITLFLKNSGIGLLPVMAIIPLLSGLVTGITIAFVGLSLPLLLPMLPEITPWNIMFIFACGFGGVLLSPVHLCLVITCQYFKVKLFPIYRYLIPAVVSVTAVGLAGYLISTR